MSLTCVLSLLYGDLLTFRFQTELGMNAHATVSDARQDAANEHTTVSDVHPNSSNVEVIVPDVRCDIQTPTSSFPVSGVTLQTLDRCF
jgi:hypothetical protein